MLVVRGMRREGRRDRTDGVGKCDGIGEWGFEFLMMDTNRGRSWGVWRVYHSKMAIIYMGLEWGCVFLCCKIYKHSAFNARCC